MDLVEIARWLNREKLGAAPCPWLRVISIFVDERYENYDYDVLGPAIRRQITRVLKAHGFRQHGGRVFAGPVGRIELPRPAWTLSTDPADALEAILQDETAAAFVTPTQAVYLTVQRASSGLPQAWADALLELVYEHPANLDKVWDWVRRSDCELAFRQIHARLAERQEEGRQLRRRHAFRSRLPS